MRILETGNSPAEDTVVAVGVFDGVHLGHQELFGTSTNVSGQRGLPLLTLTFSPHPRMLTGHPNGYDKMLTPPAEKAALLQDMGSAYLLVMPFTRELAATSPEKFAEECLLKSCRAKHVVCGFNFTFGHKGAGTPSDLETLGRELGFSVSIVPPFSVKETAVSSTRVRSALALGDVAEAAACLGRPYALTGLVAHGDGRGRTIGIPTSNLNLPDDKVVPAGGVYAAFARVVLDGAKGSFASCPAVVNIGTRPTFGGTDARVEAHIPGFSGELYGRPMQILFVERLRDERAFPDAVALRNQVLRDVGKALAACRKASSFTLPGAYDRMLALNLP